MERSGAIGFNFNSVIFNSVIFNSVVFSPVFPARLLRALNLMEWKISFCESAAEQHEMAL
jgi:hypothetical protein